MNAKWKDFAKTAQWNYDANSSANGLGYAVSQPMSKSPSAGKARDLYEITSYGGRLDDRQRRNAVKAETWVDAQAAYARAMQERSRQIEAERARRIRDQISDAADRNRSQMMMGMNPILLAPGFAVGGLPTTAMGTLGVGAAGLGVNMGIEAADKVNPNVARWAPLALAVSPVVAKSVGVGASAAANGARAAGRAVSDAARRGAFGRDIKHLAGNRPTQLMTIGPGGYRRLQAADPRLAASIKSTESYLPGETAPRYFVQAPLSAQGRTMMGVDNTMLDDAYSWFRNQLRTSWQGTPIKQLVHGGGAKNALTHANRHIMDNVEAVLTDKLPKGTLGQTDRGIVDRAISIALADAQEDRRPTFAHEFDHVVVNTEPKLNSTRSALLGRIPDAAVTAFNKVHGNSSPDKYIDAYELLAYLTKPEENSARVVANMQSSRSRSFPDMLRGQLSWGTRAGLPGVSADWDHGIILPAEFLQKTPPRGVGGLDAIVPRPITVRHGLEKYR